MSIQQEISTYEIAVEMVRVNIEKPNKFLDAHSRLQSTQVITPGDIGALMLRRMAGKDLPGRSSEADKIRRTREQLLAATRTMQSFTPSEFADETNRVNT